MLQWRGWGDCLAMLSTSQAETQAGSRKSLLLRLFHSYTTDRTELFCAVFSVFACLCVFQHKHVMFCICTCWLCCCLSWSSRARRACKEAKLALSAVFSWHTLSKRSSSPCSFWVRRNTWKTKNTNTDLKYNWKVLSSRINSPCALASQPTNPPMLLSVSVWRGAANISLFLWI